MVSGSAFHRSALELSAGKAAVLLHGAAISSSFGTGLLFLLSA